MDNDAPHFDIVTFLPEHFFSKDVNEPFIKKIMAAVLKDSTWEKGNPDCFEPDYFYGSTPFEFTLASDSKKKNNFIQKYQCGTFNSDDVETDLFGYIEERIADKASKYYSVSHVHLCVLCMLEMFNWVSDEYGSLTHIIIDYPRQQFFAKIKETYINTGLFSNIFFIVPDMCAKWWVFDVLSDSKAPVQLTDAEIKSRQYPFVMIKEIYEQLNLGGGAS